jgi:hypothetical protein
VSPERLGEVARDGGLHPRERVGLEDVDVVQVEAARVAAEQNELVAVLGKGILVTSGHGVGVPGDGRRAVDLRDVPLHVLEVEHLDLVETVASVVAPEEEKLPVDPVERVAGPGRGQLRLTFSYLPFPECWAGSSGGSARSPGNRGRPARPARRGPRARTACCPPSLCSGCCAKLEGPLAESPRARCFILYRNNICPSVRLARSTRQKYIFYRL